MLGTLKTIGEKTLGKSSLESTFHTLLGRAPIAIWSIAKDGTYLMCDGKGLESLNLKPGELVGKNFFEFRKNSPRLVENVKRALEGETFRADVFHQNIWLDTWYTPEYDSNGNVISMIAISIEIDERKKNEEQLKIAREQAETRSEAKSRFLSHVSHEIRTPMTTILGFSEILKKEGISEKDRALFVEKIERGGKSLLRLVDDLLDISKIEAGKTTVEKKRVNLTEWLSEVVSFMEFTASKKHIILDLKYEGKKPKTIYTDINRARQILTNLLSNAIKFTEKGAVTLTVRCYTGNTSSDDVIEFEVEDTGAGIIPENQKNLFKPFGQGDKSISGKYGGTGLGLFVSKQWAERMGGSLELVRSEPGKGSCFLARIKAGPFD